SLLLILLLLLPLPPKSTLFPYTTLFRSPPRPQRHVMASYGAGLLALGTQAGVSRSSARRYARQAVKEAMTQQPNKSRNKRHSSRTHPLHLAIPSTSATSTTPAAFVARF